MTENNNYEYEVAQEPIAEVPKNARIMGIISMILGILSLTSFYAGNIAFPIAGFILANIAKKKGETKFSKIGKILSAIALILAVISIVLAVIIMLIAIIANM